MNPSELARKAASTAADLIEIESKEFFILGEDERETLAKNIQELMDGGPTGTGKTMSIFQKPIGGDRKKNPTLFNWQFMPEEEIRGLQHGQSIQFLANDDRVRECRVTSIYSRKKDGYMEVRVKYGLKEYASWPLEEAKKRIVIQAA
jgi:hypothetical protein